MERPIRNIWFSSKMVAGRFSIKIWLQIYSNFCLPWCYFVRSKRSLKLSVSNVTQVGKGPEKSTLSQFLHHKISVLTKFERKTWTIGVYSLNLIVAKRAKKFHNQVPDFLRNIFKNLTVSIVRKNTGWSRPQIRLQVSYIKFEIKTSYEVGATSLNLILASWLRHLTVRLRGCWTKFEKLFEKWKDINYWSRFFWVLF